MAFAFTPAQEKVIKLHNRNILVSAAAGSGKTAVLVERIVRMVCDEEEPVDIDQLLVVTFTNAAAAEMRERIGQAITLRLEEHPESAHLQRQATLIHNAQITTIDSFCLYIIRNHFNDIGLDPSFRVADEGELKLLKQEVLSELLEERFAQEDEVRRADFEHCVECYAAAGREKALEEQILKLYEFSMSYPWPKEWIKERMEDYNVSSEAELEEQPWVRRALQNVRLLLEDALEQYREAIALAEQPDGPYMYGALLEKEKEALEKSLKAEGFFELGAALSGLSYDRLPAKKDETVSAQKRELAKGLRTQAKELVSSLWKKYYKTPKELVVEQSRYSERALRELLYLCLEFKERLDEKKRKRNIVDFGDLEHFALNILLEKTENGVEATKTAQEYRSYFKEILIDEYQDSNLVQEYLLQAISGEEEGNYNRFMVGDVKQSIYKFRLARPELFLEKYHTYSKEEAVCQRIDLRQNFRSRKEILSGVNFVFSQIMGEKLGGISYDEDAALYPGAIYPENKDCGIEFWLMEKPEKGEQEEKTAKELEAFGIAQEINRLIKHYQVTDKQTGELRPLRYKDIVLLLRTNSGWDEVFKEEFAKQGVPAYVTSRTGYFSTTEIQNLMQFLKVLDNPLQDIPLFGAMKASFGGFLEEEIVKIKLCAQKEGLYVALSTYAECGEEEGIKQKAALFLEKIAYYRRRAVFLPVRSLLQEIIADYDYLYYVAALPAGGQRRANVEMLLEKAADFEKTSYYGLFHFIRYMEQVEKYDVDYGEANTLDENADVVRIMSIHKSKGLEFPVVFVAGLSKRFNMQDASQAVIMDADMGLGTDYVDPVRRITNKTLRKSVIADKMKLDNLAEELRVLYVAMTRAKEKLILTGTCEKPSEKIKSCLGLRRRSDWQLSFGSLSGAGSYLDYVIPALIRHKAFDSVLEKLELIDLAEKYTCDTPDFVIRYSTKEELLSGELEELVEAAGREEKLIALNSAKDGKNAELGKQILERFAYRYPHEGLKELYTKTTVSELKLAALEEKGEAGHTLFEPERIVPYIPAFMREKEKISGTTRGSAFHKAMELLLLEELLVDWKELNGKEKKKRVTEQLKQFVKSGSLSEEYYAALSVDKLCVFLDTDLAERMKKAEQIGNLYREQPFVYGIAANRLNQSFASEETVLIQGIVDVFFIEEDGLVLVDYKTDVIDSGEELLRRYETQLDYYAEALESMWGMKVKEQILYSFYLQTEVQRIR